MWVRTDRMNPTTDSAAGGKPARLPSSSVEAVPITTGTTYLRFSSWQCCCCRHQRLYLRSHSLAQRLGCSAWKFFPVESTSQTHHKSRKHQLPRKIGADAVDLTFYRIASHRSFRPTFRRHCTDPDVFDPEQNCRRWCVIDRVVRCFGLQRDAVQCKVSRLRNDFSC